MPSLYGGKLEETCHELDVIVNIDYGRGVNVETGEVFENVAEEIEKLQIQRDELLKYFCGVHIEHKADIKKFKDEIERLKRIVNAIENHDKWIVNYVTYCLKGEKWKGESFSIYYGTAQDSVEVNIEAKNLPEKYRNVEYTPMKKELLKAIKSGEKIDGVVLKPGSKYTVIR